MVVKQQGPKKPWIEDYMIKGARIMWRNFGGREERYNAKGDRNFTIFLRPEDSAELVKRGLNVKTLPVREEGQVPQDILKVKVKFTGKPARLIMVTHRGRTQLDEESAGLLDQAEIKRDENGEMMVDLILSPYHWDNDEGTKGGVAVKLKSIYVTIVEDELEMEYGDLPEATGALRSFDYTPDEDDEAPSGPRFR